jgi:hypothetical protein
MQRGSAIRWSVAGDNGAPRLDHRACTLGTVHNLKGSLHMKTLRSFVAPIVFAVSAGTTGIGMAADHINLVYSGVAVANERPAPTSAAFNSWCLAATASCFPTVQQPVYDTATGQKKGMVYVWGAFPFHSTANYPAALCFSEFIVFVLSDGEISVHSRPDGTCGAFMDPAFKPPLAAYPLATAVIAGGGDGVIAGGTGRYANWTGTFTDRVFVGFGAPTSGVGGIIYYDQLIFRISRN